MAHFRTKYETTLTAPDGRKFLLFYVEGRSFSALLRCVRRRGEDLTRRLSIGEDARATREGSGRFPALNFGNGWRAEYSGRTQKESRDGGELPWIFGAA